MSASFVPSSMGRLHARERHEMILSRLNELPTLPSVAAKLLSIILSDETSVKEVGEILQADAALAANILRLVGRADLGVRDEGLSVARAVGLLGLRAVRNAVLAVQVHEIFAPSPANGKARQFMQELWRHNVMTACGSEMIAELRHDPEVGKYAFLGGLLHDLGKIALTTIAPKSYLRVIEQAHACGTFLIDEERELLGLDHTAAGKHLAKSWDLPGPLIEVLWLHHQPIPLLPLTVTHRKLIGVVQLANALVRQCGVGNWGRSETGGLEETAEFVGVSAEELNEISRNLPAKVAPYLELLGIGECADRSGYTDQGVSANRNLAKLNSLLMAENESLLIQAKLVSALNAFADAARPHDRIADVCVSAARAFGNIVEAEQTLAIFGSSSNGILHAGTATQTAASGTPFVFDLNRTPVPEEIRAATHGNGSRLVRLPQTSFEGFWSRTTGTLLQSPIWSLAIACEGFDIGAILFAAAERGIRRLQRSSVAGELIAATISQTVSSCHERIASERLNDELLDVNRRFRDAQPELVRARSIAMIAKMAAGAAHELNNPLSVISGRAQMLLHSAIGGDEADALRIIIEQAERAAGIVNELMEFAKPGDPQPTLTPLKTIVEDRFQHWKNQAAMAGERWTLNIQDRGSTVYADPQHVRIILDEALSNAVQVIDRQTGHVHVNSPSRASDETVRLIIEDNGMGMTPSVLEHAIDPFFSSRSAGRGRGLGLSRAVRLAEMNGGRIRLSSNPIVGTTVTIELPARAPNS